MCSVISLLFGRKAGRGRHESLSISGLGSRMGFARTPAQPRSSGAGSLQLPCPRPSLGWEAHFCISIKTQMHPSFGIFRVSGKGTEQGRQDRAADVWPEETQDVSRPQRSTVVLQPQGHWPLHLQAPVWGSECALVLAPCLPTCVGLIEERVCVPGSSFRSPGLLGPWPSTPCKPRTRFLLLTDFLTPHQPPK